jgi:tetratricopeptide (TPR) repeat protein
MLLLLSRLRGFVLVFFGVLCLLQPAPARAQCAPARVPPSPEYLDLVTRYVSSEPAPAVVALGRFDQEKLRCDLDNLQAAALAVSRCRGKCDDRAVFERFPVRGALLLHAAREVADQFRSPVAEQAVTCATGPQAQAVERLASILVLVDPDAKAFLSRFYLAMTRRAHWSHCIPQAEQWARTGLKRLPKDGDLLTSLGIVLETTAFLTLVPSPRSATLGAPAIRQLEAQTARLNALWERARRAFDDAVAADPSQFEARLRLGRVLWRLHRPEAARACFEEVLRKSADPVLLYLAHLFLGRIHEDEERFTEAEQEYQAALKARPTSEAASVAISHARLLSGDVEGAREFAALSLEQVRTRIDADPYKNYPMTHTRSGQSGLDELREALVR